MSVFTVKLDPPNEAKQTLTFDNVSLEFICGLWLGDCGFRHPIIEEITHNDEEGNVIRRYAPSSLQDINLTDLVIDEGDYNYELEENPEITWRQFVLARTNGRLPDKQYTALMREEYGDYQEAYVVKFDTEEFIHGVVTITTWRNKDWREILSHLHKDLDTAIEVGTLLKLL